MIVNHLFGLSKRLSLHFIRLGMIAVIGILAFPAPVVLALTDKEADNKLREIGFNVDDPSFPSELLNAFREMVRSTESGFTNQKFTTESTESESLSGKSLESGSAGLFGPSSGFSKEPSGEFQVYQMRVNPDRSVTLRWEGPADKVFDVEVSRDLVNWQTVARDHPSDNGFSIWTDTGKSLGFNQVKHPAEENRRFYRIRPSETLPSSTPSGTVSLTSYDSETGIAKFEVNVDVGTGPDVASVSLLLSGVDFGSIYDSPYIFEIDTTKVWNGEHEVRAIIRDESELDEPGEEFGRDHGEAPGIFLTSPISFTTDNFISCYRLEHLVIDSDEGDTQVVTAWLRESAPWTLTARDGGNQIVWSTSGESRWISAEWNGLDQNEQPVPGGRYAITLEVDVPAAFGATTQGSGSAASAIQRHMTKLMPYRFGVMWQGHHPSSSGSYFSSRPRTVFGSLIDFTAASGNGPWGRIGSASVVADVSTIDMMFGIGYRVNIFRGDDEVTAADLRKASAGGTNSFNEVDIGLYIGHASAGKQAEISSGLTVPQAYIPIYNSGSNSWDWVRTIESEFGSDRLKWMHLMVCNYFRASPHRSDSIFAGLQNSGAIPMNTDLHVLSSMASEVWLNSKFSKLWTDALKGDAGPGNSSVVDAWGYAISRSQKRFDSSPNVARSVYWPENRHDRIHGHGQNTTPNANNSQWDLLVFDTVAQ